MARDHIDTEFNLQLQPIGENNTKDVQSKLNRNKLSSRSMLGRLRSPDRDDSVQNTGADSVDETRYRILASACRCCWLYLLTTNHPIMVLGRALQTRTHDRPNSTSCNRLDSAHPISQPATEQTTK